MVVVRHKKCRVGWLLFVDKLINQSINRMILIFQQRNVRNSKKIIKRKLALIKMRIESIEEKGIKVEREKEKGFQFNFKQMMKPQLIDLCTLSLFHE